MRLVLFMNAPLRFFFYGTLLPGAGNEIVRQSHRHLRELGAGSVRGKLVAIPDRQGWYPALLPGEGQVHGRIFAATSKFSTQDLDRLDQYEGYFPKERAASDYLRRAVPVSLEAGGSVMAQAYFYNRTLARHVRRLDQGDFAQWLAASGEEAFRGL